MILVTSPGIRKLDRLDAWLGDEARLYRGWGKPRATAVDGWGRQSTADKARRLAQKLCCPFWSLEDGFLRSIEPGGQPLSLVVDDIGIYYDASRASRLENLIAAGIEAGQAKRAEAVRSAWCAAGISKYNHM